MDTLQFAVTQLICLAIMSDQYLKYRLFWLLYYFCSAILNSYRQMAGG